MRQKITSRFLSRILIVLLLAPIVSNASFIESTMGTAVVNDATAAYYNPAALTLLENPQIIALGTYAQLHSQFTGEVTQSLSNLSQSGTSKSHSNFALPSSYFGIPVSDSVFFGLAVLGNNFNRDMDQNSILRYVVSDNDVKDIDAVPAIGLRLNDYLSIGIGIDFAQATFSSTPISGSPALNAFDVQSENNADASAVGSDLGILLKASPSTLIGLNYRSSMTYHFSGTSKLDSSPPIVSNNLSFDFWTPAKYVLSINQFLSKNFGLIGTVQWIKWDIYNQLNVHDVATQINSNPVILSDTIVPLHYHNAWIYTLGDYYRLSSKWVIRMAGSYVQSPGNANYQITEGDNIILGASIGYKLSKAISIDASYAHAFVQNQTIDAQNAINTINGINKGYRDSVSLKITANV